MGAVYRATDTKLGREVATEVRPEAFAAIYGVEERAHHETGRGRAPAGPLCVEEARPLAQ